MTAWRVQYDRDTAFVHGPKTEARRRIAACGDPNPLWVKRRAAWATSPIVANRVLDQLEGKNPVCVEDVDQSELEFTETEPANIVRQAALW